MSAPALPLVEELVPAPDPWDVAQRLAHLPHLLFLDSADPHPDRGRYSYVAANPGAGGGLTYPSRKGRKKDDTWILEEFLAELTLPTVPGLPPFQGGLAGFLSYELGRSFELLPVTRWDEFQGPAWELFEYDWVVSFDHHARRAWIVSCGQNPYGGGLDKRTKSAAERLAQVHIWLSGPPQPLHRIEHGWAAPGPLVPGDICPQYPLPGFPDVTSNFDRPGYEAAVRRAIEYIHAGDCFQVNLSQRLLAPIKEHPFVLYGRLRERNPAPFAGYFEGYDYQIVSASPERFLNLSPDAHVETRPIKGTRPRGRTPDEDEANRRELLASPKDRAENVMIVDLLRNDLGRVCEYGSIHVTKLCELESYRTVHHLVSEVVGKLRPGLTAFDLLRAAFPGGSVTGAPKVRAMEIIAELEPTARGPYCGSLGWIGFDGAMDTNILIRTMTLGRGWVQFPVGGGIVADSDPAAEYEETLHKAAGLLRALE
jgi:para-aminobenzoate synthetase component 1